MTRPNGRLGTLLVAVLLVTTSLAGCIGNEGGGGDGGVVGPDEIHRPDPADAEEARPFSLFLCKDGYHISDHLSRYVDNCNHRVTKPLQRQSWFNWTAQHGPANEVDLAVNPNDPLQVAGGAKDYTVSYVSDHAECGEYTVWMGTYASQDGGLTWSNDLMPGFPGDNRSSPLSGNQCNTDPVLEWDTNGTLWFSGLNYVGGRESMSTATPPGSPSDAYTGSQLYFARSTDGGEHYPAMSFAAQGDEQTVFNDKQWFAVQPNGDHLIATWSQFYIAGAGPVGFATDAIVFTESMDGGASWTPPQPFRPGGDSGDPTSGPALPASGQFSMPRYLPGAQSDDGEVDLAVIWWNGTHVLYSEGRLTPSGTAFGPVQSTFPVNSLSSDEGRDGTGPTEYRLSTYPVLAVDRSGGPCDGTRYVIWADQPGPVNSDVDVLVRTSEDGSSWSEPTRIHDVETNDQIMPWIDVGPNGTAHAIWYDKRNDPANVEMDVYHALSEDCGETWTQDLRVTETAFDGDLAHHQNGRPFIGDYISVDATQDSAHIIWADTRHAGEDGRENGSDVYSATLLRGGSAMDIFDKAFER